MLDLKLKRDGVKLRLVGFGPRKRFNLRVLEVGLASMKQRLARGIGSADTPTAKLSKRYAIRKTRLLRQAAKRDMRLTGAFLDSFLPRYADEQRAAAYASGRLGRAKAILYKEDMLNFSASDIRAMSEMARRLVPEEIVQVSDKLTGGAVGRMKPRETFRARETFARQAA
jgi:hypothetical protein